MQIHLLADIGKSVIAAGLIGLPSYLLKIPLILSYILAGVIIGPHLGLGLIEDSTSIASLSEIGLVLLMFILGLEINIKKLLQTGATVLLTGSVQIFGCLLLGAVFFSLLPFDKTNFTVLYLAVACALSSTLIVVKILSDQMDLDSLPSRITLGILVLQDLFAIGFIAIQPSLNNLEWFSLVTSFSKVGLLVLISVLLARFLLPELFKKASRQPELMLILAMAWCFAMCGLADYLSLSLEMGALIAGISIASFPYHLDVAAKISSLRDFFITLFFVGLGLQIPVPNFDILQLTVFNIFIIFVSRLIIVFPTLHRLNYANRSSLIPAVNLSQVSEFSLVLISLGVSYNHVHPDMLSAFIISFGITSLVSSFLIPRAHALYKVTNPFLEKIGFRDHVNRKHGEASESEQQKRKPSIVVLGFYRDASSLLFEMKARFPNEVIDNLMVVDFNPEAHKQLKAEGIHCQYGDISSVDTLRHLNLEQAKIIISSIPDKILKGTTNLKLLKVVKPLAPEAHIIVTAENINLAREMYNEGASYVYIPRLIGANYLAEIIERIQMDGTGLLKHEAEKFLKHRVEIIP